MFVRVLTILMLCGFALPPALYAAEEEPGTVKAVVQIEVTPNDKVFADGSLDKPLELKSADDAKQYFGEASLKTLAKKIDWDQQTLLIFAWHGSGGDKMTTDVKEGGEKGLIVQFFYKGGMTRDLRPHVYVYAVRKGLPWEVVRQAPGRP